MHQDEGNTVVATKLLEKEHTKPRVSKGKALGVPGVSRVDKSLTTVIK